MERLMSCGYGLIIIFYQCPNYFFHVTFYINTQAKSTKYVHILNYINIIHFF